MPTRARTMPDGPEKDKLPHLWFWHIPKTGGTSVKRFFLQHGYSKAILKNEMHAPYDRKRSGWKNFIFLRDPLKHSLSMWEHIRTHPDHSQYKLLQEMDFHTYAVNVLDNVFINFLRVKTVKDGALKLREFDFVGFTDRFDNDMDILCRVFCGGLKYKETKWNTSKKSHKISQDTECVIREKRAVDFELVKIARLERGLA